VNCTVLAVARQGAEGVSFYDLTEQGTAEQFIHDYGREFCYLPAFNLWRAWNPETGIWEGVGEKDMRGQLARYLVAHGGAAKWGKEDPWERNIWARHLSWQGQVSLLSLLKHSPGFCVEPEQFDRREIGVMIPSGLVGRDDYLWKRGETPERGQPGDLLSRSMAQDDLWYPESGAFYDFLSVHISSQPGEMAEFLIDAMKGGRGRRVALRSEFQYGSLGELWPEAVRCFGGYVESLPRAVWLNPRRLSYGWARRIEGARILFLESAHGDWDGQREALELWAQGGPIRYLGADGLLRTLTLPTHFVLMGTGTRETMVPPELSGYLWFVPPVASRAGRRRL
jgi:hypothetical protein